MPESRGRGDTYEDYYDSDFDFDFEFGQDDDDDGDDDDGDDGAHFGNAGKQLEAEV